MRFADLRAANLQRAESAPPQGFGHSTIEEWNVLEWTACVAGEAGEAVNVAKKPRRGDPIDPYLIAKELADTIIYADLAIARLGLDTADVVAHTFNAKSAEIVLELVESDGLTWRIAAGAS